MDDGGTGGDSEGLPVEGGQSTGDDDDFMDDDSDSETEWLCDSDGSCCDDGADGSEFCEFFGDDSGFGF